MIFLRHDDPRFDRYLELHNEDNNVGPRTVTGTALLEATARQHFGRALVEGLIDERSITLLYGPSGCGKTTIAASIVRAVLAGEPWCGRPTRQGRVLYISAEVATSNAASVAAAIYDGADAAARELYDRSLSIVTSPPPMRPKPAWDNLQWNELDEWLVALQREYDLIVIDNWVDALGASSLNETIDAPTAMQALKRIIKIPGAAVLVLHHVAKPRRGVKANEQDERGSLHLRFASNFVVPVTLGAAGRDADGIAPVLHFASPKAKVRGGAARSRDMRLVFQTPRPGGPLLLVDSGEVTPPARPAPSNEPGETVEQAGEAAAPEVKERAIDLLKVIAKYSEPTSLEGLATETGCSRSATYRQLRQLISACLVDEVGQARRRRYTASDRGLGLLGIVRSAHSTHSTGCPETLEP